jgi:hypothetical protein
VTSTSCHIDAYDGVMLNHLEMLYRPGERDLAMSFCRMMGWDVTETGRASEVGSTYIVVRLEPRDPDYVNNVFYLSEIRDEQLRLERALDPLRRQDASLEVALDDYLEKARSRPHGIPHCGIRYRSFSAVQAIVDTLGSEIASASSPFRGRVSVDAIGPDDPRSMSRELLQAFVHTDVVCSGLFLLGQLFELQGQERG